MALMVLLAEKTQQKKTQTNNASTLSKYKQVNSFYHFSFFSYVELIIRL